MKIANHVKLTVFVKEEEEEDKIKKSLLELIPFDLEKEKIMLEEKNAIGFNEKQIKIIEVVFEKDRHILAFLNHLISEMEEEVKERILEYMDSRVDEEGNFFLRFSKEKWIEEKRLWVTDQGNCFHIKVNVAAFPKKKEIAIEIIRKVFKVEE